ncbi:hypothetical protein FRC03_004350 [Tulasnella sp. 419]|nr:hypothetical protein FRC03_004350 [Tulasnella sp. 419]
MGMQHGPNVGPYLYGIHPPGIGTGNAISPVGIHSFAAYPSAHNAPQLLYHSSLATQNGQNVQLSQRPGVVNKLSIPQVHHSDHMTSDLGVPVQSEVHGIAQTQAVNELNREGSPEHGSEQEGILLWPTGNMSQEWKVGTEPSGWKLCHWSMRSAGTRKGVGEVRECRGVFQCGSCYESGKISVARPKTDIKALHKQIDSQLCHQCHTLMTLHECEAKLILAKAIHNGEEFYVRTHSGSHSHAKPPVGKLHPQQKLKVDSLVKANPTSSAFQLRIGTGPSQTSLTSISPTLADPRKARHAVEQSRVTSGLISTSVIAKGGFGFIESLKNLRTEFTTDFVYSKKMLLHGSRNPSQMKLDVMDWSLMVLTNSGNQDF